MSRTTPAVAAMVDPTLVRTLGLAGGEWLVLIVLGLLTLDGGAMAKVTLIAALAYAAAAALFVARRGTRRPTWLQRLTLLVVPVPLVMAAYWLAGTLAGR